MQGGVGVLDRHTLPRRSFCTLAVFFLIQKVADVCLFSDSEEGGRRLGYRSCPGGRMCSHEDDRDFY